MWLGGVYAVTGDEDRAIAQVARYVEHLRPPPSPPFRGFADIAKLRSEPRFEALLNDPKNNAPLF
ncbi:MAG: hypothetical protein ABIQ12_07805 [Opitutaceae bacterium]